jgi:hypothetical protein
MGADITVVMADWEQLARIPAAERLAALTAAVEPPSCCRPCEEADFAVAGGWVWQRQASWCAEYRFAGTGGSYKPHFRMVDAWERSRPLVASDLREVVDCFLGGLVWDRSDGDDCPPAAGFPEDLEPWCPVVPLVRAPEEVPPLVRAWGAAVPRLGELGPLFDGEAGGGLLREWGEVATRAGERGWGLVGLPY